MKHKLKFKEVGEKNYNNYYDTGRKSPSRINLYESKNNPQDIAFREK